jgi:hypothetical protein
MSGAIRGATNQTPQAANPVVLTDATGRIITTSTVTATSPAPLLAIPTNTTGYIYFSLDGVKYFTIQGETSGTAPTDVLTCTFEATAQPGTEAQQATLAYQDLTSGRFGVASAVDQDFFWECDAPIVATWGRVKYVTSNASGNDCTLTLYIRTME